MEATAGPWVSTQQWGLDREPVREWTEKILCKLESPRQHICEEQKGWSRSPARPRSLLSQSKCTVSRWQ